MRASTMEAENMLIWLGTGIAGRRKAAYLTLGQLARKARLKIDVIERLESGEYDPSVRELYAIAGALDSKLGDMFR